VRDLDTLFTFDDVAGATGFDFLRDMREDWVGVDAAA
jgi:hypothetical protein